MSAQTTPVTHAETSETDTLREQDFVVLAEEWWHFEFGTRLWAALTGQPAMYGPTAP